MEQERSPKSKRKRKNASKQPKTVKARCGAIEPARQWRQRGRSRTHRDEDEEKEEDKGKVRLSATFPPWWRVACTRFQIHLARSTQHFGSGIIRGFNCKI
jgi:hypothetical protein